MKDIFLFIVILSIYKSYDWTFHGMVIEIIFNNKIQIFFFSNQFIFLWGKMCVCTSFKELLSLNFNIVTRKKIWIRYQISKMMFCVMFQWSKLNRMQITILSQQVRWLGGKRVDYHPWGSRIYSHRWHGLWLMVGCWLNIPYLLSLLRLSAY